MNFFYSCLTILYGWLGYKITTETFAIFGWKLLEKTTEQYEMPSQISSGLFSCAKLILTKLLEHICSCCKRQRCPEKKNDDQRFKGKGYKIG